MEGKIIFSSIELKEALQDLKERDQKLYTHIERALSDIKLNVFVGRNVKKNLIPKSLIQKYDINNLFIIKSHALDFFKGFKGSREIKNKISSSKSKEELMNVIEKI